MSYNSIVNIHLARSLSISGNFGIFKLRSPLIFLLYLTFPIVILNSDMNFAAIDNLNMTKGP